MREGYYNNAIKTITRAARTSNTENVLKYYQSVALLLQGMSESIEWIDYSKLIEQSIECVLDRTNEAIRDLDTLKSKEDVGLGSMLALVYAHKKFATVGKSIIFHLTI